MRSMDNRQESFGKLALGLVLATFGVLAILFTLLPAVFAGAQPAPGDTVTVTNGSNAGNDAAVIDIGDVLTVSGNYEVQAGASVTVEDDDGTQGTFTDGVNATITANGELIITVTGAPTGVTGGNLIAVDGVTVVSTTGVSDATDVDATDVDATDVDVDATDVDATDVDVTDVDVTDVDVTDVDVTDDATDDQYGDDVTDDVDDGDVADDTVDDDVADDASDVLDDTVPDKPLPNTGGMPLSVLIVGFALVCGGSVILRSGIRRKE
ncbi:MAG: hypothetical protein H0U04_13100 [Rubrobacter sp.]|nr:hypothetical protein [Rubrobacter sp.]